MPQRIVWLTDIHLNFVSPEKVNEFVQSITDESPDAILLGGDIGEADTIVAYLEQLAQAWTCPIYFVLGNHDFYNGSIAQVRGQVANLASSKSNLHYLTGAAADSAQVLSLNDKVAIVGHDGWADARVGDYMRSTVMMNDYRLIEELANHDKSSRLEVLQRLGDEAGSAVERLLCEATSDFDEVYLLTHLPPFREACWHDGAISNDEWAPHFTCMAVGHAIRDVMRKLPSKRLTVFCGHTHGGGICHPESLPNVTVETGAAVYGAPAITKSWTL